MQNLLENAIKFFGSGNTPKISISAELQDNMVLCRIQDNGIGIDPRYHEKVFRLFDRLEVKAGGTGIGLALVKRIIEVHGGKIRVESDGDGKGSIFNFYFLQVMKKTDERNNEW
jgi:signal transduction histidine kinase